MSSGAERRLESRLRKLESMISDPKSVLNLESLLVSFYVGYVQDSLMNAQGIH